MSCGSNDELSGASASMLPSSSSISNASSSNSSQNINKSVGAIVSSPNSHPKTAIVQAGTQLIITTISQNGQNQKVVTQTGQTQKLVSVASATNGNSNQIASSSAIGSSSSSSSSGGGGGGGNNTNGVHSANLQTPISQTNLVTTSGSSNATTITTTQANPQSLTPNSNVSYPIQQFQTFSDNTIYPPMNNTFYNQNNQSTSNFPTSTLTEQQTPAVYYMYQDTPLELDSCSFELDGHVSHTAQAAPITVQWLVDNFEPAEGCSLRRSSLYNFYMHHCNEQKIEPVNPASFGKLIRSVFLGLRTRRLGTRGNSKYHYYGIRVKATSPLNQIPEDHAFAIRHHSMNHSKRLKTSVYFDHEFKPAINSSSLTNSSSTEMSSPQANPTTTWNTNMSISNANQNTNIPTNTNSTSNNNNNSISQPLHGNTLNGVSTINEIPSNSHNSVLNNTNNGTNNNDSEMPASTITPCTQNTANSNQNTSNTSEGESKVQIHHDYLGIISNLPNLGSIKMENISLPDNCVIEDIKKFEDLYLSHCEKILDLVIGLKLGYIDTVWQKFWRSSADCSDYEQILPTEKFIALCELKPVIEFVKKCDYQFYQFCVDTLIPDVLRAIPGSFTQQIRNFAKSLENWLKNALVNIPEEMQETKLRIINAFAMTLRRYTTLNHLSQAAKALLQNTQQINQMLQDLNRVDFHNVQEQASWVCDCEDYLISRFEKEFKQTLQEQSSLEDWANWLDSVVTIYLQQYEGTDKYVKMARQFLLKWSFYCSTVIRDLTLRSASSFGSFHLIRLLYDEYMFFLIEHKIAKAVGETSIAVMSDFKLLK